MNSFVKYLLDSLLELLNQFCSTIYDSLPPHPPSAVVVETRVFCLFQLKVLFEYGQRVSRKDGTIKTVTLQVLISITETGPPPPPHSLDYILTVQLIAASYVSSFAANE